MIDTVTITLLIAGGTLGVSAVIIARLIADAKLWYRAHNDYREMWLWQQQQSEWLRKELEQERHKHEGGPYR